MLDIKFILSNPEIVKKAIELKHSGGNVDSVIELQGKRSSLKTLLDDKRTQANAIAKQMGTIQMGAIDNNQRNEWVEKGKNLNREITLLQKDLSEIEQQFQQEMLALPNIMAADTPVGTDDRHNVEIRKYLTPRAFDFVPKSHLEIGQVLDLIDFEAGEKVTGPKFYFLKNEAVLLEQALKLYVMQLAAQQGYTPLITPDIAKKSILVGTGFSPRGEESNIYNLENLDLSLIATAEITVGGYHAGDTLKVEQLPLKYIADSHCFRREAGGAGRENKGLYRVHQFSKIELFQITTPEHSEAALNDILAFEESIYQQLELPYRVLRICGGDLGSPAYKKYDLEVWMPGRDAEQKYGEVTSASNCTDFQSRRLNIKYKDSSNNKFYPHTLNGTAIALSRTILAILENYQQKDGRIVIPQVLRKYLSAESIPFLKNRGL